MHVKKLVCNEVFIHVPNQDSQRPRHGGNSVIHKALFSRMKSHHLLPTTNGLIEQIREWEHGKDKCSDGSECGEMIVFGSQIHSSFSLLDFSGELFWIFPFSHVNTVECMPPIGSRITNVTEYFLFNISRYGKHRSLLGTFPAGPRHKNCIWRDWRIVVDDDDDDVRFVLMMFVVCEGGVSKTCIVFV